MKYEGYAVNTWDLPLIAMEDIKSWLNGKMFFVDLLNKYDAMDNGYTFKSFKGVVAGLKEQGYKLEMDDGKNFVFVEDRIIIVEDRVPTDKDVWKSCDMR